MNILKEEKQQFKNQIDGLQASLQNSKAAVKCLNKVVNENKRKHEKEREHANKNHKSEIKSWKKELGLEKSQRIKAERKLVIIGKELSKTPTCSILSDQPNPRHSIFGYGCSSPYLWI